MTDSISDLGHNVTITFLTENELFKGREQIKIYFEMLLNVLIPIELKITMLVSIKV